MSYVPILDTQLDPDAPLTSQLAYQWRDNPEAIALGLAGATRVQGKAIAGENNGLLITTVSASDAVVIAAGVSPVVGTLVTNSATYVLGQTFTINAYSGSMRFKCTHAGAGGGTSSLQLRKNGAFIATFTTISPAARSVDSTVAFGDVFEWYHAHSFSGNDSTLSAISVTASDGYVERPVYCLASQL